MNNSVLRLTLLVLAAFAAIGVQETAAQASLSGDVLSGMSEINEKDVRATISFLASDEMAGRDTPSPELTIASAYVAARFRGAGLIGGVDGSFYQTHRVATVAMPNSDIEFKIDGVSAEHFGVLAALDEDFSFIGSVTEVEIGDDSSAVTFDGAVLVDGGEVSSPREQFFFRRQLRSLKQQGATCILIKVNADSPMVAAAIKATRPRLVNPRQRASLPTLLVSDFDTSKLVSITIPKRRNGDAEVRNVIGVLPGSDEILEKEAVVFSAHLDHVGSQAGLEDPVFNGADDDATGVTGVIKLADAFAALKTPPKRTMIFMTFWGEEKGLLGSRHYVNNPTWPLDKIVANINIEMIGRPEAGAAEKCWMTGWDQSDLGALMAEASDTAGVRIFEHPKFSQMLYRASDNYSFVEKGVVAHSFSAGSLHDDYHQPGDEWEKLELRHMTRVIQGLFVGSLPIANGEVTPKSSRN